MFKGKLKYLYHWYEMMILDHGFLRLIYHNFHKIDESMYRSNMPTPKRIKEYKTLGIKTIINLRGGKKDGGWYLEKEACEKYGIDLICLVARSRSAPDKEMIFKANTLFKIIKYPALIHCKSGADRAGIISYLYKILKCKVNPTDAKKQLSFKYLHVKYAKTGLLDMFCEDYENYFKNNKNVNFLKWVREVYDPERLEKKFKENKLVEKFLSNVLRRE